MTFAALTRDAIEAGRVYSVIYGRGHATPNDGEGHVCTLASAAFALLLLPDSPFRDDWHDHYVKVFVDKWRAIQLGYEA